MIHWSLQQTCRRISIAIAAAALSLIPATSAQAACKAHGVNVGCSVGGCCAADDICLVNGANSSCDYRDEAGICAAGTDCLDGTCVGGQCVASTTLGHQPCFFGNSDCASEVRGAHTTAMECYNGICLGKPGQYCVNGADCGSGACTTNVCQTSGTRGICSQNSDCGLGNMGQQTDCVFLGNLVGGYCALPAGDACVQNADCASNSCVAGTCALAQNGGSCSTATDCANNQISHNAEECVSGVCVVPIGDKCNQAGGPLLLCVTDPSNGRGATCVANVCMASATSHNTCSGAGDCWAHQTCIPGADQSGDCFNNTGQVCTANSDCVSWHCAGGPPTVCTASATRFGPCTANADCGGVNLACDVGVGHTNLCLTTATGNCNPGDSFECMPGLACNAMTSKCQ